MKLDAMSKLVVATATPGELKKYPMLVGNAVVISTRVLTEGWFTSAFVDELPEVIIKIPVKNGDFNCDEVEKLAPNGVVPIGTRVKLGTPMAIGLKTADMPWTEGEKLLVAIFGGTRDMPCVMLESHLMDDAIVVRSDVSGKNSLKVGIDLLVKRPLLIGDVLEDNHSNHFVVAAFGNKGRLTTEWQNIDVLIHPSNPLRLTQPYEDQNDKVVSHYSTVKFMKVTDQLEKKLAARAVGFYNNMTQTPVHYTPTIGQKVNAGLVVTNGYIANAREMLTVKCDSIDERNNAYEAMTTGSKYSPASGISESTLYFFRLLQACGFATILKNDGLHISRMPDDSIEKQSHGEVTEPNTINYRTRVPEKNGIMCEKIFGPKSDYVCACGKYKRMGYKGVVCDICGVEVTLSIVRRARFGHIKLTSPVIHPFFIGLLPSLLNMTEDRVRAILDCEEKIEVAGKEITGSDAVIELLKDRSVNPGPFLLGVLPVLPPDLRPLFHAGNSKYVSSDLNNLYRYVINRNKQLQRMIELNAPDRLILSVRAGLQQTVENIMMNKEVKGPNDRVLRSLVADLDSLVENFFNKRTDYSAKAVCIPDPSLPEGTLGVPDMILRTIFRPMICWVLKDRDICTTLKQAQVLMDSSPESPEVSGALDQVIDGYPVLAVSESKVIGSRISRRQGEALCVNPCDAKKFGINFSGEHLSIHVPLSDEAKQECMCDPTTRNDVTSTLSLLSMEKLVEHALANEPFKLGNLDQLVFTAN